MSVFMLDCDAVTATASSINSLVAQYSQIADSVKGYDTSCEDGFDFAGAKSAIAANIDACTTKVQNTVKLIEGVVSSHTNLQNSFSLEQTGAADNGGTQNKVDTSTSGGTVTSGGSTTGGTTTGGYTGGTSGGSTGGYTGGTSGGSTGGYTGGTSGGSTGGYSGGSTGGYAGAGAIAGVAGAVSGSTNEPTVQNPTDLTQKVNNVSQVSVDVNRLDAANKTPIVTGMTYNDLGYATYDNKYVIVCDTSMGNIGDNIVFTRADGTTVDCVVGAVVDYSQEYKGTVSFIVNDSWNAQGTNNLTIDLNNVKILNNGQYTK